MKTINIGGQQLTFKNNALFAATKSSNGPWEVRHTFEEHLDIIGTAKQPDYNGLKTKSLLNKYVNVKYLYSCMRNHKEFSDSTLFYLIDFENMVIYFNATSASIIACHHLEKFGVKNFESFLQVNIEHYIKQSIL